MMNKASTKSSQFDWKLVVQSGLIAGVAILYVCLVGMVEAFDKRDVIYRMLTLGRALLVVISLGIGYIVARKIPRRQFGQVLLSGLLVGLVASLLTAIFVLLAPALNLRTMFVNASPALLKILTFSQKSPTTGLLLLTGVLTGLSFLGAVIYLLPGLFQRMIITGLSAVLLIGMLQEFLSRIGAVELVADFLFGRQGLSVSGVIIIFIVFAGLNALWLTQRRSVQKGMATLPPNQQRVINWGLLLVGIILLLVLPQATDPFITQIMFIVGLYILMGLGLNIDIGLAGLLDLGFVGFFAIGAYTTALLTSTGELGLATAVADNAGSSYMSFWLAIPIAIIVSSVAGVILGIPVLRMRGDYLAIVTLGFAEIIRILVLSDFLRPFLGGAQGILNIPKPVLALSNAMEVTIKDPKHFYYVVVVGCLVIAFIAWRLQNARIGRNWMALREDEDVAEAMGINLIASKLLAFGIGAGFAGLSGAIFASQVGSVFPHSFALIVSINVLSLIIVGGIGSIPGVVVGSLVLVGLPELLREFAEFRLLIYGMLLVAMMLIRPEGFWPSEARRRELREGQEVEVEPAPAATGETAWEMTKTVST